MMTSSRTVVSLTAAVAVFALSNVSLTSPAFAGDAQTDNAANLNDVVVQMPSTKIIGRDAATGAPIQEITTTARLRYNPIVLTTYSGRALLDAKVARLARSLCAADALAYVTDDDGTCLRQAIRHTQAQLDAVAAQLNAGVVQRYSRPAG
jgi:UrcA family protein